MVLKVFVVYLFFAYTAQIQSLELVTSPTLLPNPLAFMTAVYDGSDSIYLWGGESTLCNCPILSVQDILVYSINNETIQQIGTMVNASFGTGVWTGSGNLLHFGGINFSRQLAQSDVWKFDTTNPSAMRSVAKLSSKFWGGKAVWTGGTDTYIFGGHSTDSGQISEPLSTISKYSNLTDSVEIVGQLPSPRGGLSAVWDDNTQSIYLFGGMRQIEFAGPIPFIRSYKDILKFNPVSGSINKVLELPLNVSLSCAVWTGKFAYIISAGTSDKIFRYDPTSNRVEQIDIAFSAMWGMGCVYVEKLNRIYIFGGRVAMIAMNRIYYIDLNEEISCKGHPDGRTFRNPLSCTSYYICSNENRILQNCGENLQFNPRTFKCDSSQEVKCEI
jgi:hypothetical protein